MVGSQSHGSAQGEGSCLAPCHASDSCVEYSFGCELADCLSGLLLTLPGESRGCCEKLPQRTSKSAATSVISARSNVEHNLTSARLGRNQIFRRFSARDR